MKQILDLLCLPAWVLVRLAAKCDGDACPLMWSFFSVVDGAEVRLQWWGSGRRKRACKALFKEDEIQATGQNCSAALVPAEEPSFSLRL